MPRGGSGWTGAAEPVSVGAVAAPMRTLALAAALTLAACSPAPTEAPENDTAAAANAAVETVPTYETAPEAPPPSPTPSPSAVAGKVLALEGLGDLKVGEAVPAGSSWAERGAQESDACRTVSSPDFPGAYAIVTEGKVRRITIGQRSDVKLVEGIGVGAREADVKAAFPGFRETPHKYVAAPGKYLTAPGAGRGGPALRFEIGEDGRVSLIHVGTIPVLGYVEGCS